MRGAVLFLSALFGLLFLFVALHRLRYPFELDRMESGMVTSVWRLRHGSPLYSAPSMTWAPFLYAPLFFWVSAALTHVVGVGYPALRLVSIASTLGSFGLIFTLVWTETRRFAPALFAAGLFASLYVYVVAWYDIGRVDSLATCLFLAALLATRRTHPLLAAVLWLLAFLAKQTLLPLGLLLFLVEWRRPARMLTGMVAYLALAGTTVTWLNHASHGWFRYYAFGTPGVLGWSMHTALMFPFADLCGPLPVAVGLILAAALTTRFAWRTREGTYLLVVTTVVTAAIWYVRAHVGANTNALIPLYAWIAVLAGIALDRLLRWTAAQSSSAAQRSGIATLLWLLAATQLAAHLYRPAEVPTGDRAARERFLAALRATPGDVWVTDHPYDALLAGKPLHADMDALDAVLGRNEPHTRAEFVHLMQEARFSAVVLDRAPAAYKPEGLFTAPPFTEVYRARAAVSGAGEPDQPSILLFQCAVPLDALGAVAQPTADRSGCPR